MNLLIEVSTNNYDNWKKFFDSHSDRSLFCDESKTVVTKVSETAAVVLILDVNMEKTQEVLSNDDMASMVEQLEITHTISTFEHLV